MSVQSLNTTYTDSSLVWSTTPVDTTLPIMAAAVSATDGVLVYEDGGGEVRQILAAEFAMNQILPIVISKLLTSGTITKGAGATSTITTSATNVRIFW